MLDLHRDRFFGWVCLLMTSGMASNAVAGEICDTTCHEKLPSHAEARFEHVRDCDGEPWKVLIVPRVFQVVTGSTSAAKVEKHTPAAPKPSQPAPAPDESAKLPEIKGELTWVSTAKQPAIAEDVKKPIASVPDVKAKSESETESKTETADDKTADLEPSITPATIVTHEQLASLPSHVNPHNYRRIYNAIPFVRSEYEANPSYRHEATMEILFGQLRPQVNVKRPTTLSHVSRAATPAPLNYLPQFRRFYNTGYYGNGLFQDGYTVLGAGGPFYRPWGVGYPGAYNTLPPYFSTYGGYGARRWLGWGY